MKHQGAPQGKAQDSKRTVAVATSAVAAFLVLAMALVFTNAYGSARIAGNARALHWANATLGSASIARASTSQAIVFAVDDQLGVAAPEAAERALDEAEANLSTLETWLEGWSPDYANEQTLAVLEDFAELNRRIIDHIGADRLDDALASSGASYERVYGSVALGLEAAQQSITEQIERTEDLAGLVAAITRFLVTLLIPAAAIIIYRWLAHRQAMRSNLALQAKLDAERRLSRARDEFIANISHEIRTPLTSIYGFSEILIDEGLIDPDMSMELIRLINGESAELSRMVEDLLTAARLDAGALNFRYETVSAAREVDAVVTPLIRTGAQLAVDVPEVGIHVDQMRFRQVVRNLVSNAIKHGGDDITITGRTVGDSVQVIVADNGPGVPEGMEDRIFERFVHEGTQPLLTGSVGLGLAIASMLTEEMSGALTYDRAGGETRFVMTIPSAASRLAQMPADAVPASSNGEHRPTGQEEDPEDSEVVAASTHRGER